MSLFHKALNYYHVLGRILFQLPTAVKQADNVTYYPEEIRKSSFLRKIDNIRWLLKNHEANMFYTTYGLDIQGIAPEKYMDYWHFMNSRNEANKMNSPSSETTLLRDKFIFYHYMHTFSMPTPEVFGIVKRGKFYDIHFNEVRPEDFLRDEQDYFIKVADGECASFVKYIQNYSGIEEIRKTDSKFMSRSYILQRRINQCRQMQEISPLAINTIRIVTVQEDDTVRVLSSVLRMGTKETGNVDNWDAGGVAVGIEADGRLKQWGFFKRTSSGTRTEIHPDTRVRFSDIVIPMWDEAVELACKAHSIFRNLHSIGWDIVITDDGPIILEGNDNWAISMMQACNGPMRDIWLDTCGKVQFRN